MEIIYFRAAERVLVAACVPILLYIGYRLFESGATGKINLTAKTDGHIAKLTNLSPGLLCFVLSAILGGAIIFGEIEVKTSTGTINMLSGVQQGFSVGGAARTESRNSGAISDEESRLSKIIMKAYSEIGLEVQEFVARPNPTIAQVKSIVRSTVRKHGLKRDVTQGALNEIVRLESGELRDDQALLKLREDFLGRLEQ